MPDGTAYLIMEYVAGESLMQRMTRPGWQFGPADMDLVRQVALALATVHQCGIITATSSRTTSWCCRMLRAADRSPA